MRLLLCVQEAEPEPSKLAFKSTRFKLCSPKKIVRGSISQAGSAEPADVYLRRVAGRARAGTV